MIELLTYIIKGIVSVFVYLWPIIVFVMLFFAWQNRRKAKWVENQDLIVLHIKIPKANDKNPTAAEMMFATLHGILKPHKDHIKGGTVQEHISFEIVADHSTIQFYIWTPKHLKDFVEGQVYAQYPTAEITENDDYTDKLKDDKFRQSHIFSGAELVLTKEDFLPIKTFNNFQVDPLAGITGVLAKLENKNEQIWIQMLARPVEDTWKNRGLRWVKNKKEGQPTFGMGSNTSNILEAPFKLIADFIKIAVIGPLSPEASGGGAKLTSETEGRISAIEEKSEKLAYKTKIRIVYLSDDSSKTKERINAAIGAFKQFNTTNLNGFKGKKIGNINRFLTDYKNRIFFGGGYHLNIEELASIYHLPHTSVETPNINWTTYKTGEQPTTLPTVENTDAKDISLFAETNYRSRLVTFGIKRDDRRRHMYIIGKSGMGKTKLLENLVRNDIENGEGIAIIDPHGDFCRDIIKKIPEERINDVVMFDPSDTEYPIGFNPMEVYDENMKNQIASGIVTTFKKIFGTSWGPRLEYILNYTVLALLDTPDTTLLGIVRMLQDKKFRKKIVDNIKDPVVKKFWTTEFATYNDRFATEAIAPILNKVGQFVANSLVRNVVGQPKSSFKLRDIMDNKKIFLVNLSKGNLGEANASLLGSLMITALQLGAMSRSDVSEEERPDFYLYVDEFQNFATESFQNILSEARKYRLNLIVANQYTAQIDDTGVKEAVFGNVGTIVTFRVGARDADELAKEFNPPFEPQDLINLPRQNIYIKMTIDGQSESPFSAKTLFVDDKTTGNEKEIFEQSRSKYTKTKKEVEEEIAKNAGINVSEFAGLEELDVDVENTETSSQSNNNVSEDSDNSFAAPILDTKSKTNNKSNVSEVFEAPIVNNRSKNKKSKRNNSNDLSKIIKENTAHLKDNKDTLKKGGEKIKENKKDSTPQKVRDMIDKETLSTIIEHVVTPNKKEINKDIKTNKKPKEATVENNINKKEKSKLSSPTHMKNEKVITPKNFKDLKHIHPHEVVKLSEEEPKDIKEGEEIKF